MVFPLWVSNHFHLLGSTPFLNECIVSKFSSCTTWNWGLICTFCKLRIRSKLDTCCFDLLMQTSTLILSSHLGILLLFYSEACSTCARNPKAWLSFTSNEYFTVLILSIGYTPLTSNLYLFLMLTANGTTCGQRACVITSRQRCIACVSMIRAGSQIIFMRFSALPF